MDWCGWNFRHETHLWSEHSYWALTSMLTSLLVCVWTFIVLCLQVSQTGGLQSSTVCLCLCVPALKSHNSKFVCVSLGCMSVSQLLIYISVSPSVSCPVSIFVFVCGSWLKAKEPVCLAEAWTLTFLGHANLEALLQPAVLATVACDLVDLAVLVTVAGVHHVLLNTATEETLQQTSKRERVGQLKSRSTTIISLTQAVSILFKVADPELFLLMMSFCFCYIKG